MPRFVCELAPAGTVCGAAAIPQATASCKLNIKFYSVFYSDIVQRNAPPSEKGKEWKKTNSMLRERDSWTHVSRGQAQKSRTRRQLLLCTMLPAVLLASFFVSAIFTVGHLGQRARAAMLRREHAMAKLIDDERKRGGIVYRSPVHWGGTHAARGAQLLHQDSTHTISSDDDTAAATAAAATPPRPSSASSQPAAEQQLQRRLREGRAERLEQQEDGLRGQQQPAQVQMPQQRRRDPAVASEHKTSAAAVLSPS